MMWVCSSVSSSKMPPTFSGPWGAAAAGAAVGSVGSRRATELSVTFELSSIKCPQRRHFIRTVLPETLSSAIWYFALQLSQRNFIEVERLGAFSLRRIAMREDPSRRLAVPL